MRTTNKKLTLSKQTLHTLSASALAQAAGGATGNLCVGAYQKPTMNGSGCLVSADGFAGLYGADYVVR
jgi:hypothetical protein